MHMFLIVLIRFSWAGTGASNPLPGPVPVAPGPPSSARLEVMIRNAHRQNGRHQASHRKRSSGFGVSILFTLTAAFACAEPVYTWVDDEGVTHFSETPPPAPAADTRFLDLEVTPPPASPNAEGDDFYSVINQAKRMETRRLESEKLAAEKKKAEAEARKARAEAAAIQRGADNYSASETTRYYPVYPYYPRYRHHPWRPGHGHRPPGHGHRPPGHPRYPRPKNPRTSLGKTPGMPR